jgi:phosphohistidine swiveling domain-containing protein
MADDSSARAAELYKKQISLTEWFASVSHSETEKVRAEDNNKREVLRELNEMIGLPYDAPMKQFASATELGLDNPKFVKFLDKNREKHCALRLIPLKEGLAKLRMRGRTVAGAYDWFLEQNIEPKNYRADFMAHAGQTKTSTIFVVNSHGISGEIIRGSHDQLTQGFHWDNAHPHVFYYDFSKWQISPADDDLLTELKKIAKFLRVDDTKKQEELHKKIGANFAGEGYLCGYFETVMSDEFGLEFCDFSQSLGRMYDDFVVNLDEKVAMKNEIRGRGASAGVAQGKVKIVKSPDDEFPDDAVLVAAVTTPDLVGLMKKASAIITDRGGILSHAAIVARELGKPCVVDTGDATTKLHDGQLVEVNGEKGIVKIL